MVSFAYLSILASRPAAPGSNINIPNFFSKEKFDITKIYQHYRTRHYNSELSLKSCGRMDEIDTELKFYQNALLLHKTVWIFFIKFKIFTTEPKVIFETTSLRSEKAVNNLKRYLKSSSWCYQHPNDSQQH